MTGTSETPIRDAATLIILRDQATKPRVLMGQRGKSASFMPDKFVFPGGAVDPNDSIVPVTPPINPVCAERLRHDSPQGFERALVATAIRELWEETGLRLGVPGSWPDAPPQGWRSFSATGLIPSAAGMRYVFRAITPAGRPRRFDARFLLVDADKIAGDLDDFTHAEDELGHIQWVPLEDALHLNLPFITEVVLNELAALPGDNAPLSSVPFFDNRGNRPIFSRIA